MVDLRETASCLRLLLLTDNHFFASVAGLLNRNFTDSPMISTHSTFN
jgi:hypothetical protein